MSGSCIGVCAITNLTLLGIIALNTKSYVSIILGCVIVLLETVIMGAIFFILKGETTKLKRSVMQNIVLKDVNEYRFQETYKIHQLLMQCINNSCNMKMTKKSYKEARTDAMTGIPNRLCMNEFAKDAFKKCIKNNELFGVEIIDIDYFKEYNDNYGHTKGDECITAVAQVLNEISGRNSFVTRYGGDEFVIIYTGYGKSELKSIAKQIRQQIEERNLKHKHSPISDRVTISQGIAYGTPSEELLFVDFMNFADKALYESKRRGKNSAKVICMDELMGEKIDKEMQTAPMLEDAEAEAEADVGEEFENMDMPTDVAVDMDDMMGEILG